MAQIIEKHREFNIPTHMAFIDYQKVFNSVNRTHQWEILSEAGIPQHLIHAIKSMNANTKIRIKINDTISNDAKLINQGVKQGCPMSPSLFNMCMYRMYKKYGTSLITS